MKVLFDGFWWVHGPPSNQAVARELLLTWHEQYPDDELVLAVRHKERGAVDVPPGVKVVTVRLWPQALASVVELSVLARRQKPDAIVSFNFAPIGRRGIVFVHDLMFTDHPEWFSRAERAYFSAMPRSLRWAAQIVTSSRAEAGRVDRILGRPVATPVGLGVSRELITAEPQSPFAIDPQRFALIVGRMNVRKNLETVLRAARESSCITAETPLIVVGDDAYSGKPSDVRPYPAPDGDSASPVRFLGHISAANLKWLYQHASLTIYVPLDEGFGLPPIEAAWFGCPVVVSDLPVFRETTGGEAHFVDPQDAGAIAAVIDKELSVARPRDRTVHDGYDARWVRAVAAIRERSAQVGQAGS